MGAGACNSAGAVTGFVLGRKEGGLERRFGEILRLEERRGQPKSPRSAERAPYVGGHTLKGALTLLTDHV